VERKRRAPKSVRTSPGVFCQTGCAFAQPLQCDPTVAYALTLAGKYTGNSQRRPRFASPYNTYHNRGLAARTYRQSGRSVLQAAAALRHDDLYFRRNTEAGISSARPFGSIMRSRALPAALLSSRRARLSAALPLRQQCAKPVPRGPLTQSGSPDEKGNDLESRASSLFPRFTLPERRQIRGN